MDKEKQEYREISTQVENKLFPKIKIYREFGLEEQEKNEIENFVQRYVEKYTHLTRNEIKDTVLNVLNRTFNNLKRNKDDDAR